MMQLLSNNYAMDANMRMLDAILMLSIEMMEEINLANSQHKETSGWTLPISRRPTADFCLRFSLFGAGNL